jgi:hypothetical protein
MIVPQSGRILNARAGVKLAVMARLPVGLGSPKGVAACWIGWMTLRDRKGMKA